jgi:hypothetical protein
VSTRAKAGATITVRMAERQTLYAGDVSYGPGDLVELPRAEAKALLDSGQAIDPDAEPASEGEAEGDDEPDASPDES